MISFAVGFVLAVMIYYVTGLSWPLVIIFWVLALPLQIMYTHRLNAFLGGIDPVATYGTKNLRQLKTVMSIPLQIKLLHFSSKILWWAGLAASFISFGWFGLSKF